MDTDTVELTALPPKEQAWQKAIDRIGAIEVSDPHGFKVDEGIKKSVVGLNALEFNTTFSCEGHLDHGYGYPYIRITERQAQQQSREASNAYMLQRHIEYQRLRESSTKLNKELLTRLNGYLDDFYASRSAPDNVHLTASIDLDNIILRSHGSEAQKDATTNDSATNLTTYQHEMAEFSDFLEQKFFEK